MRAWSDWDRMRSFTFYLTNGIRRFLAPSTATKGESFEEAIKRMNIDEQTLEQRKNALFRLSVLMLLVAGFVFVYMWYQLFFGTYIAAIVSLVVTMIGLVLAFRYHFWYFQMKTRKLGCSIDEWFRQGLMGEKK